MPIPEDGGEWGVLGGAFDPVHYGHLTLAEQIHSGRHLTGVLFVPSFRHPFKQERDRTEFDRRVDMLELALDERPSFHISRIEAEQELSGYTLDTVRALKRTYPDVRFYFLVGSDNLEHLTSWHRPHELLEEVTFIVGARPGHEMQRPESYPANRFEFVPTSTVDISSSRLREMLKDRSISMDKYKDLIPPDVVKYIREHNLYQ